MSKRTKTCVNCAWWSFLSTCNCKQSGHYRMPRAAHQTCAYYKKKEL